MGQPVSPNLFCHLLSDLVSLWAGNSHHPSFTVLKLSLSMFSWHVDFWWMKDFRGWKKGLEVTSRHSILCQIKHLFLFISLVGRLQTILFGKTVLLLTFVFTDTKIHVEGYKFKNKYYISEKKKKKKDKVGGIALPGMWWLRSHCHLNTVNKLWKKWKDQQIE